MLIQAKSVGASMPVIDLTQYAAFDGVTDDTTALNNFIAGLPASGGYRRLIAPFGKTALISGALNFSKANLLIEDLSVKVASGVVAGFNVFNVTANNLRFLRPVIDGNSSLNNTKVIHGIGNPAATPINDLAIEDGIIINMTAFGIFILNSSATNANQRIKIINNYINNVGAATIWGQALTDSLIAENNCVSAGWHAMGLQPGSGGVHCSRVTVENNFATKATPPSVFWPGTLTSETGFLFSAGSGVDWLEVSNNIFWDNRNAGSYMDGISIGNTGADPIGLVISDNVVGYTGGFGIAANFAASIEGNITYKTSNAGIGVEASTAWNSTISHAGITGNTIIDPFEGGSGGAKKYDAAIVVSAMTTGCTLTDINIFGNTVYDTRATKNTNYGVSVDNSNAATVQDVSIKDNNFRGVNTGAVSFLGTAANYSNIQVKDNDAPGQITTISGATPSVLGYDKFIVSNGGATTMTSLLNGYEGQGIILIYANANTTLNATGNIYPKTLTPAANTAYKYVFSSNKWYEV